MPSRDEGAARWAPLAVVAIAALGFALTVWVFYPGVMTYDARYVHAAIAEDRVGDWQSPLMTVLWSWIDWITPPSASMFLFVAASYWLAVALFALVIARTSPWLALVAPLLAMTPPAFILLGVIWRDILFAALWLFAAALALVAADARTGIRLTAQAIALVLVLFGYLLRQNALFAAPVLVAFVLWPSRFALRRTLVLYVPAVIALYGLTQVVYYGVLHAMRQTPIHAILVFDLGGITYFTGQNQFPVSWTPEQDAMLTTSCYDPSMWDGYWLHEPCLFVMDRLDKQDHLFGTPALVDAWKTAVLSHPIAYLRHRADFMWTFLTGDNLTMFTWDLDDPTRLQFPDNHAFVALVAVVDALKPTPLFRPGLWFLVCVIVCTAAWRRRDTPAGAYALATCGSAILYMLTFLPVGLSSDYRYAYWAVLAGLTGAVAAAVRPQGNGTPVIPGPPKAGPGIQRQTRSVPLDSGFASCARAPE